jgi:hypothetical protein
LHFFQIRNVGENSRIPSPTSEASIQNLSRASLRTVTTHPQLLVCLNNMAPEETAGSYRRIRRWTAERWTWTRRSVKSVGTRWERSSRVSLADSLTSKMRIFDASCCAENVAHIGGRRKPPHAASIFAATASTASSSHGRPTICTPIGKPSGERPTDTTAPGLPSRLNHCE